MRQFVGIIYLFWEIHGKNTEFLVIPWKIVVISWYFEGNSEEIQRKFKENRGKTNPNGLFNSQDLIFIAVTPVTLLQCNRCNRCNR
jgi:hypothetical protein